MQIGHALRQAGMDADFAINGEEAQMKAQNGHCFTTRTDSVRNAHNRAPIQTSKTTQPQTTV